MSQDELRAKLGPDCEALCQMILLVCDTLGMKGDLPTMNHYIVTADGQFTKINLISKADMGSDDD